MKLGHHNGAKFLHPLYVRPVVRLLHAGDLSCQLHRVLGTGPSIRFTIRIGQCAISATHYELDSLANGREACALLYNRLSTWPLCVNGDELKWRGESITRVGPDCKQLLPCCFT